MTVRWRSLPLDRPEKLNALDYEMIGQLTDALERAEVDHETRAIILTGTGQRAFSAGADIADLTHSIQGGVDQALRDIVCRGQALTRRLELG